MFYEPIAMVTWPVRYFVIRLNKTESTIHPKNHVLCSTTNTTDNRTHLAVRWIPKETTTLIKQTRSTDHMLQGPPGCEYWSDREFPQLDVVPDLI